MATFIKLTGFILSLLPYQVLEKVTHLLGNLLISIPNKRKRIILSNLKYAFPEWDNERILATGKISAARMFELGFFSLTYPFFSDDQKKRVLLIDDTSEAKLNDLRKQNKPVVVLIPHVCLFESLAVSPFFRPRNGKRLGAIYRPNRNPSLDKRIKDSRHAVDIDVFSRDSALWKSKDYLKEGNWLALLFDQHSGIQGCHSEFLNRFASMTTMPDLFARTARADVIFAFPRRVGFFKACLELTSIHQSSEPISQTAHKILEEKIRESDGLPEWLWSHERWKTQQNPRFHLVHRHKRERLPGAFRRTTKFWIRMPNWLGDIVMVIPLINAIHAGRPDAQLSLLVKPEFRKILEKMLPQVRLIDLPRKNILSNYVYLSKLRKEYPSLIINFANSLRSDIESFIIGAPRRYGIIFTKRCRPLLTHGYHHNLDQGNSRQSLHQVQMWEKFLQYFGLKEEINFEPLKLPCNKVSQRIGILPGSANNPLKRWPANCWRELISFLIEKLPNSEILILGSIKDVKLGKLICEGFNPRTVLNLSGKTNLVQLAENLSACSHVFGNDSGGIHLANAIGCEVTVLFGPTDPDVTAPVFSSPCHIIQSFREDGSIADDLSKLSVEDVIKGAHILK